MVKRWFTLAFATGAMSVAAATAAAEESPVAQPPSHAPRKKYTRKGFPSLLYTYIYIFIDVRSTAADPDMTYCQFGNMFS